MRTRDVIHHHRWMAAPPEPVAEITWTLVFAVVLALIVAWAVLTGVLAIGGPS